jgi:O-methyltransferase domain/Dimerisation domain
MYFRLNPHGDTGIRIMSNYTSASVPTPHQQIFALTVGFWQSRALAVAADLEIADILAEGPLAIDVLAARTKTHAPSLFRLLRALESLGIFSQVSLRVFANTPTSECLRKNAPHSLWAFVRAELSTGGGMYEAWAGLNNSIQTGDNAFDHIYGYDFWAFCQRNPKVGEIFNKAMSSLREGTSPVITDSYDWSKFPVIADIGGGIGVQLANILDACPSCHGILFDQPAVVHQAMSHERMKNVGGDFFQFVPPGADMYILNGVIHDWPDSKALIILEKVRKAMKTGARLAILEDIIPETAHFTFGKWVDLVMLTVPGGRERTETEFRELLSSAGFEFEEIVSTSVPLSILIAKPRPSSGTSKLP